ncbi:molybdenum cofactor guanylyltransferase MobA [Microbaculum marinum]|uniref:Molybdenum cofactor guanylyltransferase n=1 Tax=Microbaculum marinum TaxID=1764581 RepID=A0AAW9RYC0_9HYPH
MNNVTGHDETLLNDNARWASLTVGCVLAGGLSRRMGGGDKSLRDLGGQPMLARVLDRLKPQVGEFVINANGDPDRFAAFGAPVTPDPVPGFAGPLAGVLAGMRWAERHAPKARWVVTVATDTPFFPANLVTRLVGAAGHHETMIALAKSGDRVHPVFGLWPVALADDLEAAIRDEELRKVLVWVHRHPHVEVIFSGPVIDGTEIDPFFNVNTPEDMEVAEALAEELPA